ncbi:MAG: hypothetical protein R3F35_18430 [Myxococcota bacterium]
MQLPSNTPRTLFVALANPSAEQETEFNRWYDEIHGPDALENGSFLAVHRFRATGPGPRPAPYLALWEARFGSEAEAWAYIGPRAQALREAGRAGGEVASVRFALMLVGVAGGHGPALEEVGALTTIQNDWRAAASAPAARPWWLGLPHDAIRAPIRWLATSDVDGRGPGHHLAVFATAEKAAPGADLLRATPVRIAPGMSPLPPYQTIFGTTVGEAEAAAPSVAPAWLMTWEPVTSQRA